MREWRVDREELATCTGHVTVACGSGAYLLGKALCVDNGKGGSLVVEGDDLRRLCCKYLGELCEEGRHAGARR